MIVTPQNDLRVLAPKFGLAVADALNQCWAEGLDVIVFEALRTAERQEWLYAQGRTRPGAVVTKARSALYSWHGYALAVDVISLSRGWATDDAWRRKVAAIFKKRNLKWGGDWKIRDYPHFQWGKPMRASPSPRARQLIAAGGMEAVWREVGAV